MIKINKLLKRYGKPIAVEIPELEITKGASFGLVGNNGAGKTTLFSLVLDLIKANAGEVLINGANVSRDEEWKSYVGSYMDENFLIGFLSVKEYFEFTGSLYGMNSQDTTNFCLSYGEFLGEDLLEGSKYIRDLSAGNKSKVGIISSLFGDPEMLVLDEPFANLDPTTQHRLIAVLSALNKEKGVTLLISSHDLNHITTVCSRIVLLENGRIAKDLNTTVDTLTELEAYFAW